MRRASCVLRNAKDRRSRCRQEGDCVEYDASIFTNTNC
jgi:hypothetical protein